MNWPADRTWVMPLGTTARELAVRWPEILDAAIEYGLNATHRLHALAWVTHEAADGRSDYDPITLADGNPYGAGHITGARNNAERGDAANAALEHLA